MVNTSPLDDSSKQRALERILAALSPKHVAQGSARLMMYATAAAAIYAIAHGDMAAVAVTSPIIARLVEIVGGNTLSSLIERVAQDEEDALSPADIQRYIEEAFARVQPADYLSGQEFYQAIRILNEQDEKRYEAYKARLESINRTLQDLVEAIGYPGTQVSRLEVAFDKVKASMPELITEMKEDLTNEKFIREFFIASRGWSFSLADPCFMYYFEDHENLQGKIRILENNGFVIDVTISNAQKYRMTEEFVELLLAS